MLITQKRGWTQQPQQQCPIAPEFRNGLLGHFNAASPTQDWSYNAVPKGTPGLIVPSQQGGLAYAPNVNSGYVSRAVSVPSYAGHTILYVGTVRTIAASQDYAGLYYGTDYQSLIYTTNTGKIAFFYRSGGAVDVVSGGVVAGTPFVICAANNGSRYFVSAMIGGKRVNVSGAGTGPSLINAAHVGNRFTPTGRNSSRSGTFWGRALPDYLCDALRDNPWRLYEAPDTRIWVPVGAGAPAGAELAGSILAEPAVTGNLTLQASLEGAALGVATLSGSLTTQIPLGGAVVGVAAVGGTLLTGIPLSGAIVASALASGSLTAQIKLDGAVLAEAAIAAGLSSAIQLAGDIEAQASVSGALTGGASGLEGAVLGAAEIVATLTTSIRLSGTVAAQAGIEGLLTTAIPLSGAVLAEAIVSGTLTVPILLAGAIEGQATLGGTLSDVIPDTAIAAVDSRYVVEIDARTWGATAEPRAYEAVIDARNWEVRL